MSGRPATAEITPATLAGEFLQTLVKALRAFQLYLPNNPMYQRATQNVGAAIVPLWESTEELVLTVAETDFVWDDEVVYRQPNKAESLAWGLFKDGMRSLTLRPGCEAEELPRFLGTVNQARFLPTDAPDDLLTLLWAQEFQFIRYQFVEFIGQDGALPGPTGSQNGAGEVSAAERQQRAAEEAPPRPKGMVGIDDFDSTLYFLDDAEIEEVARELEREYQRDVRTSALDALFDLFELEPQAEVRAELLGILEQLFPNFLNARDFGIAAAVLRETRLLAGRAPTLTSDQTGRLDAFVSKLSEPAIVGQLLQSLDESGGLAGDGGVSEVFRELRASALEPLVAGLPGLSSEPLRARVEEAAERLAGANPEEVLRLLRQTDSPALAGIVSLCGRLGMVQAVSGLGDVLGHADPAVRLGAVQALNQLGTPGALTLIDRAIDDADRAVRLAAVRAAGARGYKGALRRVEAVVLGKGLKEMELTEKMAFFEAFGAIAGPAALKPLAGILLPRGLLKMKEPAESRACAAVALGRMGTAEARELLQRAADDKDPVVRNAVGRALRGGSA